MGGELTRYIPFESSSQVSTLIVSPLKNINWSDPSADTSSKAVPSGRPPEREGASRNGGVSGSVCRVSSSPPVSQTLESSTASEDPRDKLAADDIRISEPRREVQRVLSGGAEEEDPVLAKEGEGGREAHLSRPPSSTASTYQNPSQETPGLLRA